MNNKEKIKLIFNPKTISSHAMRPDKKQTFCGLTINGYTWLPPKRLTVSCTKCDRALIKRAYQATRAYIQDVHQYFEFEPIVNVDAIGLKLPDGRLAECVAIFKHYCLVELSQEQVQTVVETDQDLVKTIFQNGVTDTYEREWLVDVLAESLGLNYWPSYGEDAFEEFWSKFCKKAEKAGYKVIESA